MERRFSSYYPLAIRTLGKAPPKKWDSHVLDIFRALSFVRRRARE
jgi:hypothetical protein